MPQLYPIKLFLPQSNKLSHKTAKSSLSGPEVFVDLVDKSSHPAALKEALDGLLKKDVYQAKPTQLYWYRKSTLDNSYAGLLCGLPSQECIHPQITTHEHVLDKRVQLFSDYLAATQLQAEPILVLHENTTFSDAFAAKMYKRSCATQYTLGNELHEIWLLDDEEAKEVKRFAAAEKQFHLADGHHRLASSIDYADKRHKNITILSFVVAKNQLYNDRFVWALKQFPKGISAIDIDPKKTANETSVKKLSIGCLMGKNTQQIHFPKTTNAASFLFEEILGFSTLNAIDLGEYIDYFPPSASLSAEFLSDADPYKAKFFYDPLSIDQIIQTAKAQKILPPKSTYLLPKLPTGLFIAPMDSFE